MRYSVHASITPRVAAKLILTDEIDLSQLWKKEVALHVLDALCAMPIEDVLSIVDANPYGDVADVKTIPQFGRPETVLRVPCAFAEMSVREIDAPQLGFYLKRDLKANLGANTKFGENHGKVAALLGLVDYSEGRFVPSALTDAFCACNEQKKLQIINRLWFRIPIVQILLKQAKTGCTNGYAPMAQLSESTRVRRGSSVKCVLKCLKVHNEKNLTDRIANVLWEGLLGDENGDCDY